MPAIPALTSLLIDRDLNTTADALQIVCAWPVSGQYGPGSRILYYVLVIASIVAQKVEWAKKACLAAALLLPAVSAIHGIVLAVLHTDGAVDMDVYGAFQLCAIGILAAPVTVRNSSTYFNDRGRNIIFAWTGLVLAGLLSLTVEFYRINSRPCNQDDNGNLLTHSNPDAFPYDGFTCGLVCDIGLGNPYSPMRDWNGSTKDIYVIPAPHVLTFGTGTLLAAACCIPAILNLVSMWSRIAEFNWRQRFLGAPKPKPKVDETIDGTNGATPGQMRILQERVKKYLKIAVETPVFAAAVLAILILGEKNFWSKPVKYQTEPIASVGQWGPIVGTALAALGSLYMILARAEDDDSNSGFSEKFPNFQHHEGLFSGSGDDIPSRGIRRGNEGSPDSQQMSSLNMVSTANNRIYGTDAGNRRRFASTLSRIGDYIGQPSHKRFDYSEFQRGPAMNYPEIPGEGNRNRELSQLRNHWTPSIQERSSRDGSPGSRVDMIESISQPGRDSPQSPQSSKSIQLPTHHRTTRANTMPTRRSPMPLVDQHPSSSGDVRGRPRQHWATLEVPMRAHLAQTRINMSEFAADTIALPAGHRSPAIVVSAEPDSPTSGLHIS